MAATATPTRVCESFAPSASLRVDRERGVISGAKFLGIESVNGRNYGMETIRRGAHKYEGAKLYLNHPGKSAVHEDRDFNDWVGVLKQPRPGDGGAFGELHLRQKHGAYESIMEAAEKFPEHFGLSHVANIDSEFKGGREIVNDILDVFSVDIVTDPATTNGIFESKGRSMKKLTNKSILEATKASKSGLRVVLEAIEAAMPDAPPTEMSEAAPVDDDAIKAGVMQAITKKLEGASPDQLKKVLKALEIGDSVSGLVAGGNAPAEGAPVDESPMAKESREIKTRLAVMEAKNLLLESGREASDVRVRAVAAVAESDRKALVDSFPVKESSGGQRPARPTSSPPASGDDDKPSPAYESKWDQKAKAARESIDKQKAGAR